jgi:hypothetical protein
MSSRGSDSQRPDSGCVGRDVGVFARGPVSVLVDRHAKERRPGGGLRPGHRVVLADSAGEDQHVEPVHCGRAERVHAHIASDPVHEARRMATLVRHTHTETAVHVAP